MDGVICSTDEYHYKAWKTVADELNIYFDREINNRLRGVSRMDSLNIILENAGHMNFSEKDKVEIASKKNEIYKSLLRNMTSRDISSEVKETLISLKEMKMSLAIGSSSKNAKFIIQRTGIEKFFDAVIDGNQIKRSKPDPEVFHKAAERLGLDSSECIVVEDSVSGVQAGHAGGMKVACVGDASSKKVGDWNLNNFSDLLTIIVL